MFWFHFSTLNKTGRLHAFVKFNLSISKYITCPLRGSPEGQNVAVIPNYSNQSKTWVFLNVVVLEYSFCRKLQKRLILTNKITAHITYLANYLSIDLYIWITTSRWGMHLCTSTTLRSGMLQVEGVLKNKLYDLQTWSTWFIVY